MQSLHIHRIGELSIFSCNAHFLFLHSTVRLYNVIYQNFNFTCTDYITKMMNIVNFN